VEQHGGWIELQSQPGRSTTFLIYLPAGSHHPTAAAPGELPLVPVPKGEETIFLVEDEETVRKLAVDILRLYGYQVISAGSGPEAVMIWAQQKDRIDVMLTDMVMPGGMSGIALAQRLREDRPDLKVLFSSGYVNTGMFLDALSPPDRQHFLQKPYSPTQLAQAIRDVLDEQPGAKP
jgi:CheY-like chemotaxis protein